MKAGLPPMFSLKSLYSTLKTQSLTSALSWRSLSSSSAATFLLRGLSLPAIAPPYLSNTSWPRHIRPLLCRPALQTIWRGNLDKPVDSQRPGTRDCNYSECASSLTKHPQRPLGVICRGGACRRKRSAHPTRRLAIYVCFPPIDEMHNLYNPKHPRSRSRHHSRYANTRTAICHRGLEPA